MRTNIRVVAAVLVVAMSVAVGPAPAGAQDSSPAASPMASDPCGPVGIYGHALVVPAHPPKEAHGPIAILPAGLCVLTRDSIRTSVSPRLEFERPWVGASHGSGHLSDIAAGQSQAGVTVTPMGGTASVHAAPYGHLVVYLHQTVKVSPATGTPTQQQSLVRIDYNRFRRIESIQVLGISPQ